MQSTASAPVERALRTEGEVSPETWGEYAAWKATKRMKLRDRQIILTFTAIDIDLRDALDEAIHEAMAAAAELADTIMGNEPRLLLHKASERRIAEQIGDALFATTWIFDILSENWGSGQLISGRHFANPEDLASIAASLDAVRATVGSPTEIVAAWHKKVTLTAASLMVGLGELSAAFVRLRWDDIGFDIEGQATRFADVLSCVEIIAAFFGFTLAQCLQVNQVKLNAEYPQGWKPAGETQPK